MPVEDKSILLAQHADIDSDSAAVGGEKRDEALLFPDYGVENGSIINRTTGTGIPDISIHQLKMSTRACNVLCRWAKINGTMQNDTVMLSALIPLRWGELRQMKNLGARTWTEIVAVANDYLVGQPIEAESLLPIEGSIRLPLPDPAVPVLGEDYAVYAGRIFRRSDSAQSADMPVHVLGLSARGSNCLQKAGILQLSQLIGMPYSAFRAIENLGLQTASEIIEKLDRYLTQQADFTVDEDMRNHLLPTAEILALFADSPFAVFGEAELAANLPHPSARIADALAALVEEGRIIQRVDGYCIEHPSFAAILEFYTLLADDAEQRRIELMRMRMAGMTLEESGEKYALSRERVRQIENKIFTSLLRRHNGSLAEDYFAGLFTKYAVDKALLLQLTGQNETAVYYLNMRYTAGSRRIEEALDDKTLPVELRRGIERWIYRNCLHLDGVYIPLERKYLEDYVLKHNFADGGSYDAFVAAYNCFVRAQHIPDEVRESLLITEKSKNARLNRLSVSMKLLWGLNHFLRYYDIAAGDYTELLQTLNLGRYRDVELSTRKFIVEYPDLMAKYDIRNEYELHNLLKKIGAERQNPTLVFSKMPILRFGEVDHDALVREAMFVFAPIPADELAEWFSLEYGHRKDVVRANWFGCIDAYYHQGVYSTDSPPMSDAHMALLGEALTDDFYFFHEIRRIYRDTVPDADPTLITPFNLKRMGFHVNGAYAFRRFDSAEAYFTDLFTRSEIVDASRFHARLSPVQMYLQVWRSLRRNYEIIEFEPMQYIHIDRLQKLGVGQADIRRFCDEVAAFTADETFFTMEYLYGQGFTSPLDALGFDNCFYSAVLKEDHRFSYWFVGKNTLFCTEAVMRFTREQSYVSLKRFTADYMQKVGSMDIDTLIDIFADDYGMQVERQDIIDACREAGLYYDRIMEKVYVDYDTYFEEI